MSEQKRGETFVIQGEVSRDAPVDFTTFLMGLASTALIHLGAVPHPELQKVSQDLPLAHESIELLAMLRSKTRGNLSATEESLFDNLLADLRMQYVEAKRR